MIRILRTYQVALRIGGFTASRASLACTTHRCPLTALSRHSSSASSWQCHHSPPSFENLRRRESIRVNRGQRSVGLPVSRCISTAEPSVAQDNKTNGSESTSTLRNSDGAERKVAKHGKDARRSKGRKSMASEDDEEDDEEEEYRESDSLHKILWGEPQPTPEEVERDKIEYPKDWATWKLVLTGAWADYSATWDGFFSNHSKSKKAEENGTENDEPLIDLEVDVDELRGRQKSMQKNMADNLGRNLNAIEKEGTELAELAKEKTGFRTKEDLVEWAGEQIKLATECLKEFMQGYREGRDQEVDRMLNEYFKEFDEKQEKEEKEKDSHRGDSADAESNHVLRFVGDKEEKDLSSREQIAEEKRRRKGRRRRKPVIIAR